MHYFHWGAFQFKGMKNGGLSKCRKLIFIGVFMKIDVSQKLLLVGKKMLATENVHIDKIYNFSLEYF